MFNTNNYSKRKTVRQKTTSKVKVNDLRVFLGFSGAYHIHKENSTTQVTFKFSTTSLMAAKDVRDLRGPITQFCNVLLHYALREEEIAREVWGSKMYSSSLTKM
jgi:hypothetical protein